MELRQLEYFTVVAKELHFTRAADILNIAQPTLSQQIKSLEDNVGVPLFDRIGKKVALTEAGNILLKYSQRIFFEKEQAEAALRDLNGLGRGKLTIGSLLTCSNYLLPPTVIEFKQLYPNIELSLLGLRSDEITRGLLGNELDLGVTFLPVMDDELESMPLFTEELSLAVPVEHELATNEVMSMKDLVNYSFILLPKNFYLRELMDEYCEKIGITLHIYFETSSLESLIQMVSKGSGITILPKPYLESIQDDSFKIVELVNPIPKREVGFAYREDKYMCAATASFMKKVIERSYTFQ